MPGPRRTSGVTLHPLEKIAGLSGSDAVRLPHLRLAGAMVYQAVKDLRSESDIDALDAMYWLARSEIPELTLDLMGIESKPVELLMRGVPENIPGLPPGRKKGKYYG